MPSASEVRLPVKPAAECARRALDVPSWTRFIPAVAICVGLMWQRASGIGWPLPIYDFMTYWAAGKLFLAHANPYSATAVYAIERGLGWQYTQPLVPLNPPWALPFVAPLGALSFNAAHYLWWALAMLTEAFCAVALWRYFGGERKKQWIAIVLVLTFLPSGAAERMGQITPLMLGALTAFLLLVRRRRDLLAGVCLIGLGMKPHLLYLVVLAILLWTARSRRWKIAIGSGAIYALATTAAIVFDPPALGYFHGTTQAALDTICGVGGALRSMFGMQYAWLQFVPTVFGVAWFALYWNRHRKAWQWEDHIPILVLVSLVTAPYAWNHDYVLALPALVALAVTISKTRTDWMLPCAFYLVLQVAIFNEIELFSKAWAAASGVLWLVFYWAVRRYFAGEQKTEAIPAVVPASA